MTRRGLDRPLGAQGASRRQLFKLLAASPFLGLAAAGLPASWQRALANEAERRAVAPAATCAKCGVEMPLATSRQEYPGLGQAPEAQPPDAIDGQFNGQLIESVDDAINVWDFERVCHANNLPQHWDYLHLGVDDFETRWANREGFTRRDRSRSREGEAGRTPRSGAASAPPPPLAATTSLQEAGELLATAPGERNRCEQYGSRTNGPGTTRTTTTRASRASRT